MLLKLIIFKHDFFFLFLATQKFSSFFLILSRLLNPIQQPSLKKILQNSIILIKSNFHGKFLNFLFFPKNFVKFSVFKKPWKNIKICYHIIYIFAIKCTMIRFLNNSFQSVYYVLWNFWSIFPKTLLRIKLHITLTEQQKAFMEKIGSCISFYYSWDRLDDVRSRKIFIPYSFEL